MQLMEKLGIQIPVVQAPMAGASTTELALAVSAAGGLGSIACALLTTDGIRKEFSAFRSQSAAPVNLNFFCHEDLPETIVQKAQWQERLAGYYTEFSLDATSVTSSARRAPFDEEHCALVEELKPPIVSFHFGLPNPGFVKRVKNAGAILLSSATTLAEALWLEENGCDVIIAQGAEAGGHRAVFLENNLSNQPAMLELLEAVVRKVRVPVIAAGGIADAAGVQAAISRGAAAVQVGTAYLFCPEANVSPLYLQGLHSDRETAITNVFTGRPARAILNRFVEEVGPISEMAPVFPFASGLVAPLRQASEKAGSFDFMQMWSGTNRMPHSMDAGSLTRALYHFHRGRYTSNLDPAPGSLSTRINPE